MMSEKATAAKVQHYVPRMVLKNFTTGKKRHLWVFDKHSGKSFRANTRNIAAESHFYDIEKNGSKYSFEPILSRLETSCSHLIQRILQEGNIGWLTDENKVTLSLFLSLQNFRTPHTRNLMRQMDSMIQEKIQAMGGDPNNVDNYEPFTDASLKEFALRQLAESHKFAHHFMNKTWVLLRGREGYPFYISDNPIALQNYDPFSPHPHGKLGLAVPGIEVYFPLSSRFTLTLCCPTFEKNIKAGYESYKNLSVTAPWLVNAVIRNPFDIEKVIAGIDEGAAVPLEDENILNINYLQVRNAERYVYCKDNDFDLIHKMLDESDDYRVGLRFMQ